MSTVTIEPYLYPSTWVQRYGALRTWIDRIACLVIAVPLISAHGAAVVAWSRSNRWPRYNNPESWSSAPLVDHPILYQLGLLSLMFAMVAFPVCGALAALSIRKNARQSSDRDGSVLIPVITLVFIVLLWVDPWGAVNWFAD